MKTTFSLKVLTVIAGIAGLSGCANKAPSNYSPIINYSEIHTDGPKAHATNTEVPLATNFPASPQHKLQAAEHWKRVANHAASEIATSLTKGTCTIGYACRTLVVKKKSCEPSGCRQATTCESDFSKVFYNQYITALVNLGYKVSTVPVVNGLTLEIDIQPVKFEPNRPQYRYAGSKTELGEGVWALKDITSVYDDTNNLPVRNRGGYLNWDRAEFATGKTPSNEIVVTVSALTPEMEYVARDTSVYYVSDADESHYYCASSEKKLDPVSWTLSVTGSGN